MSSVDWRAYNEEFWRYVKLVLMSDPRRLYQFRGENAINVGRLIDAIVHDKIGS